MCEKIYSYVQNDWGRNFSGARHSEKIFFLSILPLRDEGGGRHKNLSRVTGTYNVFTYNIYFKKSST